MREYSSLKSTLNRIASFLFLSSLFLSHSYILHRFFDISTALIYEGGVAVCREAMRVCGKNPNKVSRVCGGYVAFDRVAGGNWVEGSWVAGLGWELGVELKDSQRENILKNVE